MIDISKAQDITSTSKISTDVNSPEGEKITKAIDDTILAMAEAGREIAIVTIYAKGSEIQAQYDSAVEVDMEGIDLMTLSGKIKQVYRDAGYNATGAYSQDNTNYYLTLTWTSTK